MFTATRQLLARSSAAAAAVTASGLLIGTEKYTCTATNRLVASASRRLCSASSEKGSNGSTATASSSTSSKAASSTSTPSAAAATSAARPSFLEWYEGHLQARPIPTKMVTGSFLWGLGDVVAQCSSGEIPKDYDYERTGRAVIFGFAIHAPASHLHFNFLESITVKSGVTGMGIPIFKAFMEQFVYWSWISNSMYHGCMGAMQGQSFTQIYDHIHAVLWETQKAQWVFWIPIQLLNFKFVPVRHQLNVVLLTSVVWTALLSAWYPPEEKESAKKTEV